MVCRRACSRTWTTRAFTHSAALEGGAPLPDGLSIDAGTGAILGTPPMDLASLITIAITAIDAGGLSTTRTIGLDIEDVPDAPVPSADPVAVGAVEDEPVSFSYRRTSSTAPTPHL